MVIGKKISGFGQHMVATLPWKQWKSREFQNVFQTDEKVGNLTKIVQKSGKWWGKI